MPGFGNVDSFIGPSSFHPGGANVLLMDGSVRFIKSGIALTTWNALGTRAGGEAIERRRAVIDLNNLSDRSPPDEHCGIMTPAVRRGSELRQVAAGWPILPKIGPTCS